MRDPMAIPTVPADCENIGQIRECIDYIDREIVALLALRGRYVIQAARFKTTVDSVKASQRVEHVINNVVSLSNELGANPVVTEQIYRAMISAFIEQELLEHTALQQQDVD